MYSREVAEMRRNPKHKPISPKHDILCSAASYTLFSDMQVFGREADIPKSNLFSLSLLAGPELQTVHVQHDKQQRPD